MGRSGSFLARAISGCWPRTSVTAIRAGAGAELRRRGPEEFPIFTDWWLGKPQPDDNHLVLFAILDSVSCAGAYEFDIRPGESTVVNVEAELFFREPAMIHAADTNAPLVKTIGFAPLTSMFWFGKNTERNFDDYRPEVHDSDGLLMKMGNGEILWRAAGQSADAAAPDFFRAGHPRFRLATTGAGVSGV